MEQNKEIHAYYDFIRKMMAGSLCSQKELAEKIGLKNHKNMMNKLYRGTFRVMEERRLADELGYRVIWIGKDKLVPGWTRMELARLEQGSIESMVSLMHDRKRAQESLSHGLEELRRNPDFSIAVLVDNLMSIQSRLVKEWEGLKATLQTVLAGDAYQKHRKHVLDTLQNDYHIDAMKDIESYHPEL